jgi:hypothetical protein
VKVLNVSDVRRPQRLTMVGRDLPSTGSATQHDLIMDVYSGLLQVDHFAGQDPTELDVVFPLVFLVTASKIGIQPIPDRGEFRGASVNLAIAGYVDKSDPGIDHILKARADLREVNLTTDRKIRAVVLAATVKAQRYEFRDVGYQVTVLTRKGKKGRADPIVTPPPASDFLTWNGKYQHVGGVLQAGVPQQ